MNYQEVVKLSKLMYLFGGGMQYPFESWFLYEYITGTSNYSGSFPKPRSDFKFSVFQYVTSLPRAISTAEKQGQSENLEEIREHRVLLPVLSSPQAHIGTSDLSVHTTALQRC